MEVGAILAGVEVVAELFNRISSACQAGFALMKYSV
jgi:hypothetical protein